MQNDLALIHRRIGDALRGHGDLALAFKAYGESLTIRERLAEADPSNVSWQRKLSEGYLQMASMGSGDRFEWLRKAYIHLANMKRRGIMDANDEEVFQKLRKIMER